ncbi:hypothetical protein ACQUW5_05575 [Legionella sp. CNM-1927-20]|uniref:hypothetical protein n=1 Tax=Legionella sp. CNM-1927-20 TaxID=3422221 RepID=UPI00403B27D0
MSIIAWIVLRFVFAGFFLYPIYGFLQNWEGAKQTVLLLYPRYADLQVVLMVIVMIIISISILFGIYGHIGGLLAFVYCLFGIRVHLALADKLKAASLSQQATAEDQAMLTDVVSIGRVGHLTSAQKNIVIAAIAFFFMLQGTGPLSLTT